MHSYSMNLRERTRRFWAERYGLDISVDEADEILGALVSFVMGLASVPSRLAPMGGSHDG
jgi:hypothetical protein